MIPKLQSSDTAAPSDGLHGTLRIVPMLEGVEMQFSIFKDNTAIDSGKVQEDRKSTRLNSSH